MFSFVLDDSDVTSVALDRVTASCDVLPDVTQRAELYNAGCSLTHIRLSRCNSSDPFIMNCSQRLALGMKTIWFILLDELVTAELVRCEAVRDTSGLKTKG